MSIKSDISKKILLSRLTDDEARDIIEKILNLTEEFIMRIKTLDTRNLCESAKNGGCGECQTSCQSACKTSCGIANQQCENTKKENENK